MTCVTVIPFATHLQAVAAQSNQLHKAQRWFPEGCLLAVANSGAHQGMHMHRRRFSRCEADLRAQQRDADADLFNLQTPRVSLHDTCDYRCAVI